MPAFVEMRHPIERLHDFQKLAKNGVPYILIFDMTGVFTFAINYF